MKKMKHNLFFTGGKAELFINRCPKEKLTHLLLDQDGLTGLVAQIRAEEYENKSSAYRIAFILDASKKVGSDAKVLVENCKHAVNRMKQRGFIPADHWLVGKVRDLSRSKLPERKFANLDGAVISADVPAEVQTEAPVLVQPEVVLSVEATVVELTDPDTMTMEELEARTPGSSRKRRRQAGKAGSRLCSAICRCDGGIDHGQLIALWATRLIRTPLDNGLSCRAYLTGFYLV